MNEVLLNEEINNEAFKSGKLPKSLKVMGWGKNDTTKGPIYLTSDSARLFKKWQHENGREEIALDFDHNSEPLSDTYVKGQPKKIAAYGTPVIKEGDGMYLTDIEWTPEGKQFASNYKDLSPAVRVNNERDNVVIGVSSVALTPHGAMYGLKLYSGDVYQTKKEHTKFMSSLKEQYNNRGANAGVSYKDKLDETAVNPESKVASIKPLDAGSTDCYAGACDDWSPEQHEQHQNLVKEFSSDDDHYSKYGDVEYADEENHKYPIDTEEHIRAAWSYINHPDNAAKEEGQVSLIKSRIKAAAEANGIDIGGDDTDKQLSASSLPVSVKAWAGANPNIMNNQKTLDEAKIQNKAIDEDKDNQRQYSDEADSTLKKLAATLGVEPIDGESSESLKKRVEDAYLAVFKGPLGEVPGQITNKKNSSDNVFREFSARINKLEATNAEQVKAAIQYKKDSLIKEASSKGILIPLSAELQKTVSLEMLEDIIKNQKENTVPTKSKTRLCNADSVKGESNKSKLMSANTDNPGLARVIAKQLADGVVVDRDAKTKALEIVKHQAELGKRLIKD